MSDQKSYSETINELSRADAGLNLQTKHEHINSASDQRTVNNVMRHEYRVLNDAEKANMQAVKDGGLIFHQIVAALGESREVSIAKTKIEEAVMWAVKHITK